MILKKKLFLVYGGALPFSRGGYDWWPIRAFDSPAYAQNFIDALEDFERDKDWEALKEEDPHRPEEYRECIVDFGIKDVEYDSGW